MDLLFSSKGIGLHDKSFYIIGMLYKQYLSYAYVGYMRIS